MNTKIIAKSTSIKKKYPESCQFFHKSELKIEDYFREGSKRITHHQLQEAHFQLNKYAIDLQLYREHNNFNVRKVVYTAMIIYHIFLKHAQEKKELPSFDHKLTVLSCLRISAVINDLELSQENYTKAYYDSVI